MSKLLSNCISSKDFIRFGHKIHLRNETSQTIFIKTDSILIKELKENGIVLEIPLNVCQRGHNLSVYFLGPNSNSKSKPPSSGPYKDAILEIVAKVEKIENISGVKDMIIADITFIQYDLREWKNILDIYANKQDEINNLLMQQHKIREENE